ncbi:uncharacterized protein LOC113671747 [Pocillopora damicornis]|uniref:uncharacterized protein LOC113671747 n=1 Tax=Pocillopora damicornis TaxID=46731 RepID=UPI000F5559F5|nr:uncharacterized protein LOC113671747 [Pocillopora damicornis]
MMLNYFKLLATILVLCISTTTAFPAGINYYPQVLTEEHHDNETQTDVAHSVNANTSSLQPSSKHVPYRGARQVPGCLISTRTESCGSRMVVTVKCRKYSIACLRTSAICAIQKTYFKECGKVFDTNCVCKS